MGPGREVLSIQFYLDENVDRRVVEPLQKHGIVVHTVEEQRLKGEPDDRKQLNKAKELDCVLITSDQDFGAISNEINARWVDDPESTHNGIVFVSSPRSPGQLAKQLIEIYETLKPEDVVNLFLPI